MTSTGKKDCNGAEIFIGDFLTNKYGITYEVKVLDDHIILLDNGDHKLYRPFLFWKKFKYTGLKRFIAIEGSIAIYHEESGKIIKLIGKMPHFIKEYEITKKND